MRLPFFGERIRYKGRSREGGIAGGGVQWSHGIYVGIHRRTNQYLLFDTDHGIMQARTVMRFPDELKFDVAMAQAVNISPHSNHDSSAHDAAFRDPVIPTQPIPPNERTQTVRDMYVRQADLEQFGYTPGCPRCEHAIKR